MKKEKLNEKGIPYGARQKMPLWYGFAWSTRGVSNALNILLVGYVTYYCTDMLSLSAVTVGILLMASKVVDAVTDLCAGYIIDHKTDRTARTGRRRLCKNSILTGSGNVDSGELTNIR